jgi:hypothetical protein
MRLLKLSLLLLLAIPTLTKAQEIPWIKDKSLAWRDFAGEADTTSTYAAVTSSRIKYTYNWALKDSVYKITFKLENVFNTKASWVKNGKQNRDLLHHEQLHFDINELFTRRLAAALNSAIYTSNFREEINNIYQKIIAEERDFQIKYDSQSIHSRDWGLQVVWEQHIHKELEDLPRNY